MIFFIRYRYEHDSMATSIFTSCYVISHTIPVAYCLSFDIKYSTKLNKRVQSAITPRKQKLKKRLAFMSKSNADIKGKFGDLTAKMKTPKRVVNQTIKRKNDQLFNKDQKIIKKKTQSQVTQQCFGTGTDSNSGGTCQT